MISFTVDGVEYRAFNHLYAVSRCGKVVRKHRPYTPSKHSQGYLSLGSKFLVHRVVAECWMDGFDASKQIHHINGVKTDNRLENLRELSNAENHQNIKFPRRDSSMKYIGVQRRDSKFAAKIQLNGKQHYIGRFNTEEEAATAYLEAKRRLHKFNTL